MATEVQSLPTKSSDTTLRRIALGSILLGVIAGVWIWQRRPSLKTAPRQPATQQQIMQGMTPPAEMNPERLGSPAATSGGFSYSPYPSRPMGLVGGRPGERMQRIPQAMPRYFANLSSQAGPFVVTIRQVMETNAAVDLYMNRPPISPYPGFVRGSVSLQIMCTDKALLEQVSDFAAHLTYTDDRNRRYDSPFAGPVQAFENGQARIVYLPRTPRDLRYLKRIEGDIVLKPASGTGKQKERRIPFLIENVPLPVENHLFGVAAAAYLPSEYHSLARSAEKQGDLLLVRDSAARRATTLFPPFKPDPHPLKLPNRLLMQPEASNKFQVPLPGGTQFLSCTLKPVFAQDGEIRTFCRLEGSLPGSPALQASFSLWDNEPVVLLFPERALFPNASGNRQMALRLHCYLQLLSDWLPMSSPFPATTGERGASITGQALVRSEPVRRGTIRLKIERLDGDALMAREPMEVEPFLDEEGRFRLTNFSPGLYRIEAIGVTPYRSRVVETSAPQEHLCRRYGLKNPVFLEAQRNNLLVRGGAEVVLPPFVVQEDRFQEER